MISTVMSTVSSTGTSTAINADINNKADPPAASLGGGEISLGQPVWAIARRELSSYFSNFSGYLIIALFLLADGLLFNGFALGGSEKLSYDVLQGFFYFSCGVSIFASLFISMRLFAEERQTGTLTLLEAAPISPTQIVVGKFLGAYGFYAILTALTAYMPLLILVNGRVSWGHLVVGYVGLLLLGALSVSAGALASSLAKSQAVAAIVGGAFLSSLLLFWMVARRVDGDLRTVLTYLDIFDQHFRSLSRGILKVSTVTYYISLTWFFLSATIAVLSSRRWRE